MSEITKPLDIKNIDALKEKYGIVYKIEMSLEPDDFTTIKLDFIFKKPNTASFDRYVKTTSQSPTKALRNFMFDNVIVEQVKELEKTLEDYPACTMSIGEKLLTMLGLSKDINLKLL